MGEKYTQQRATETTAAMVMVVNRYDKHAALAAVRAEQDKAIARGDTRHYARTLRVGDYIRANY